MAVVVVWCVESVTECLRLSDRGEAVPREARYLWGRERVGGVAGGRYPGAKLCGQTPIDREGRKCTYACRSARLTSVPLARPPAPGPRPRSGPLLYGTPTVG